MLTGWIAPGLAAVMLTGVGIFLIRRKPPAPVWPLALWCQICSLLWVIGDFWATNARDLTEKQVALVVLFTGSIPLVPLWWTTVLRYVDSLGLGRPWMKSQWSRLPVWVAGAAWLLMLTNPWHGEFIGPVVGGRNEYFWGVVSIAWHNYALAVMTAGVCLWAAHRHASVDVQRKMWILAVAVLVPVVVNCLHAAGVGPTLYDTTGLGVGVSAAMILYGLYRQRLFNPLPVAIPEIVRCDPDGVMLLDPSARLLFWNPAAEKLLEGIALQPDQQVLHALAPLLRDAKTDKPVGGITRLADLVRTQETGRGGRVLRFDASEGSRWLRLSTSTIPSRSGHVAAIILRLEDVTELESTQRERQKLEEQLQQMERLRSVGLLAGGVAHDFNNLLTAIGGNAAVALEDLDDVVSVRDGLEQIVDATDVAAGLTQQLLAYAGRSQIESAPVHLSALVHDMTRLLTTSVPPTTRLETSAHEPELAVLGDATQLQQILLNLTTNAAEAIGSRRGLIRIQTYPVHLDDEAVCRDQLERRLSEGDHMVLEVSDDGSGMDEETRLRIFDAFYSTKVEGRGLGLAAVYGMVRSHRGTITVESKVGLGTTFRVWLPALPQEDAHETGANAHSTARHGANQRDDAPRAWQGTGTILVVDDEERIRRLARRILERSGFEVLTACDGLEGVEMFRANADRIRLVLLDLSMPVMGGEAALGEIRSIDRDMLVLLSSGFDETDATRRLAVQNLCGFVHKPYRPADLVSTIRSVLGDDDA